MGAALGFALLAGAAMATYILVSRLAAPGIHPVIGAAILVHAGSNVLLAVVSRMYG